MATQLNSYSYAVLVKRADGTQGEYHALEDKRWHSVEKAVQILRENPEWEVLDVTKDGKSDMEAHQALINRHDLYTSYARTHQMGRTQEKSTTTKTVETTQKLSFDEREALTLPLSDLLKLTRSIGQSVQKGAKPLESCDFLATQAMVTLQTLGVSTDTVLAALKVYFPDAFGKRKSE